MVSIVDFSSIVDLSELDRSGDDSLLDGEVMVGNARGLDSVLPPSTHAQVPAYAPSETNARRPEQNRAASAGAPGEPRRPRGCACGRPAGALL